jgi:hypothetical protein
VERRRKKNIYKYNNNETTEAAGVIFGEKK